MFKLSFIFWVGKVRYWFHQKVYISYLTKGHDKTEKDKVIIELKKHVVNSDVSMSLFFEEERHACMILKHTESKSVRDSITLFLFSNNKYNVIKIYRYFCQNFLFITFFQGRERLVVERELKINDT